MACIRCFSSAVKSQQDLDNIQKQALIRGLLTVSAGEYVTIMAESMAADRQAWHGSSA